MQLNTDSQMQAPPLVDTLVKMPLTATLLLFVVFISVLFGLYSVDDRAMMLASGASVPIRITLWQSYQNLSTQQIADEDIITKSLNLLFSLIQQSNNFTNEVALLEKSDNIILSEKIKGETSNIKQTNFILSSQSLSKQSDGASKQRDKKLYAMQFAWMTVLCLIRFIIASILITTSGEMLITIAALFFILRPLEYVLKTRRCTWMLLLIFVFHATYYLFVFTIFIRWRIVNYHMQPGLSWLNLTLYIINERIELRQHQININNINNTADTSSNSANTNNTANNASSRLSKLRLFGKIPIGSQSLRAVIFMHILFRSDMLMNVLPAFLFGFLLPLPRKPESMYQEERSLLENDHVR